MTRSFWWLAPWWALVVLLASGSARADSGSAMVTIAEGPVQVVRAVNRSPAALGVKIRAGDILMVDAGGYLRIETSDGVRVDLGPGARALWLPRPAGRASAKLLYLQTGWLKLSAPAPRGATPTAYASPLVDVEDAGVSLLWFEGDKLGLFAETGALKGRERASIGASDSPLSLKSGEFLARAGDKRSPIVPRPSPDFVGRLPRPFLDTLPARHAEFAKREAPLKPGVPVAYDDIQGWLQGDAGLRRDLLPRWRARTSDAAFKAALVANLKLHPEWEIVLFPERFQPKDGAGKGGPSK